MSHARLSPSSFYRAQLCPGSVRLEAEFPDTDNEHSLRGTAAHDVAEQCLSGDVSPSVFEGQKILVKLSDPNAYPDTSLVEMTKEDIQAVAAYVDYVKLRSEQLGQVEPLLETKVNPGAWLGREDLWGTADCTLPAPDVIEIIDYKHGYNPVEPENNSQLILYAIGVCATMDWSQSDQTEVIKMTIVQPRAPHIRGPVRSWEIPAYELFGMLEQLRAQANATDDPGAELNPGEKQCKWCKAKAACPALQEQAQAVFAPVGSVDQEAIKRMGPGHIEASPSWEQNLLRPVEVMDIASMFHAMDQEALVKGWFKSIREHLTQLSKERKVRPEDYGQKLVHADTRRKWSITDEEVIKKLMGLRDISNKEEPRKIKKAEVTEVKPLSISQAEKRIRPLVSERQWQGVQKIILKPEGAPVLAPLTDPREPIKSAEEVFQPVNREGAPEAPGW